MRAHLLGMLCASCLQAAPPVVDAIYPAGGKRGDSVDVELVGKVPDEGLQFWASHPGITFVGTKDERQLRLSKECPLGPHWLRFYNAEGSALPQLFVVGDMIEQVEKEPNDAIEELEPIVEWPVTINGRLSKSGESDLFALALLKGETFDAEIIAYRLDSPIDPLLRLVDESGNMIAWNHDRYDSLDPRLSHTATYSGRHYLTVVGFVYPPAARSRFEGSKETVYRLQISSGKSSCEYPGLSVIAEPGETDEMPIEAKKGVNYEIAVEAQSLNSPLDPWLEVRDAKGKVLAKNDDSEGIDAALSWKAPETGTYMIALRDLLRQGGEGYHYKLSVTEAKPSFEVTVGDHAWTVEEGAEVEIPLKVERKNGHSRPITVTFVELSLELDSQSVTIPGTASQGAMQLSASEFTAMIRLSATDGLTKIQVACPFKGATTDEGGMLKNRLEDFLLITRKK